VTAAGEKQPALIYDLPHFVDPAAIELWILENLAEDRGGERKPEVLREPGADQPCGEEVVSANEPQIVTLYQRPGPLGEPQGAEIEPGRPGCEASCLDRPPKQRRRCSEWRLSEPHLAFAPARAVDRVAVSGDWWTAGPGHRDHMDFPPIAGEIGRKVLDVGWHTPERGRMISQQQYRAPHALSARRAAGPLPR
jgi:hypothetical protein